MSPSFRRTGKYDPLGQMVGRITAGSWLEPRLRAAHSDSMVAALAYAAALFVEETRAQTRSERPITLVSARQQRGPGLFGGALRLVLITSTATWAGRSTSH